MSNTDPQTNSEKRDFIGGLIASVLVKKGVEKVIDKALSTVAADKSVPMAPKAVPAATEQVVTDLQADLQARAEHKLDIEPTLSSRNIWGSFVGIVTAAETLRVYWMDGQVQSVQEYLIPIGILVAALTPLYSRFIAKKPLFR